MEALPETARQNADRAHAIARYYTILHVRQRNVNSERCLLTEKDSCSQPRGVALGHARGGTEARDSVHLGLCLV